MCIAVVESRCFSPIAHFEARNPLESRLRFTIQQASSPYVTWSEKQLAPKQRLRSEYLTEIEMSDCHVDSIKLCVPKLTSKSNLLHESRSLVILKPAILSFSVFAIPRVIPIEGVIEIPLEMYSISATCRVTIKELIKYLKMSIDESFSDSAQEQLMFFRL